MSAEKVSISKIIFQHTSCSENMLFFLPGGTAIQMDSAGKEWHTAWGLGRQKQKGCSKQEFYNNFNPNSFKALILHIIQVEKKHLDDPNLQIIPKFPSWLLQVTGCFSLTSHLCLDWKGLEPPDTETSIPGKNLASKTHPGNPVITGQRLVGNPIPGLDL